MPQVLVSMTKRSKRVWLLPCILLLRSSLVICGQFNFSFAVLSAPSFVRFLAWGS